MDWSPRGSSVRGILQARILEWVAISSSRGSSWHRDQTQVPCISCVGRWMLYHRASWEAEAIAQNIHTRPSRFPGKHWSFSKTLQNLIPQLVLFKFSGKPITCLNCLTLPQADEILHNCLKSYLTNASNPNPLWKSFSYWDSFKMPQIKTTCEWGLLDGQIMTIFWHWGLILFCLLWWLPGCSFSP